MFKSKRIDGVQKKDDSVSVTPKKAVQQTEKKISVALRTPRRSGREVPEDYKTLDRAKHNIWGLIILVLLVFGGTLGALYYWNNRPAQFQGNSVAFSVGAPESIVSGDEVTFEIQYTNNDFVPLTVVDLDVQWPAGFYYNSASQDPLSENATTWMLGSIQPGETKSLEIKGQLVGNKEDVQESVFRLSYRPANINSDFEEVDVVAIIISDARLGIELASPDKVIAGSEVPFVATISNVSGETFENIDIEIVPPRDVDIVRSKPELEGTHYRGPLAAAEPLQLDITGRVADDANGEQNWIIEINEDVEGEIRRLLRKEFTIQAVRPEFDIELKINGQSSDFEIDYGETLNFQMKLTNVSDSILNDIRLTALVDSDVIDRKTVQASGITDNESIVWTKETVEKLEGLLPEEELIISWKADLLEAGTIGRASVDTVVTVQLEGLDEWKQSTPVFVVSVGEGIVFSQALYWELGGVEVGSGNLPPVTNERTEYLLVWSLDSGSQEYDTVTVSATMPEKVLFVADDETDEGKLIFDEETNRLSWQIDNFSTTLLPLKTAFVVRLVPLDEDEGTVMTVMNPPTIVASGDDVFQSKGFLLDTADVIVGIDFEGDPGTIIE